MRILLFKSESSIQISARERGSVWIEKCNYSGYGYVNSGSGRTDVGRQQRRGGGSSCEVLAGLRR